MATFKSIPGFSDYEISSEGVVVSLKFGRRTELKPILTKVGYLATSFSVKGKVTIRYIHRLLAEAFLGTSEKPYVNHIDGIKTNNNLSNLEWSTASENNQHAYDTGLTPSRTGNIKKPNMSDEIAAQILSFRGSQRQSDTARQFGVSRQTVGNLWNGLQHKHLQTK